MEAPIGPRSRGSALFSLEITMSESAADFRPDWSSPPGDTILDLLEERDWSQAELAGRLGYSAKHVNQLIKGKVPLSEDAALRLERVLGGPARFWLTREARYRARCARLADAERLDQWTWWCDQMPVRELMHAGAIQTRRIDATGRRLIVDDLLHFFGVASPDEWQHRYANLDFAFRRTRVAQSDIGAISAWLRLG